MTLLNRRVPTERAAEREAEGLSMPVLHQSWEATWLGIARGHRYVRIGTAEYRVTPGLPVSDPAPGHWLATDDRDLFLALTPVPTGTYTERAAATLQAPPKPAAAVVDVTRYLPGMRGRSDVMVPGSRALSHGTAPMAGPRALLAAWQAKGIEASVTAWGELLIRVPGGRMQADVASTAGPMRSLLVGILTGRPVLCHSHPTGDAPEAIGLAFVDVPLCGDCLKGNNA